ncbi:MAG: RHS repeat-associated core domain-containing protein [Fimbriimonadaceae bacterium]|nr:RHS repeat-associated core domain-containing protein [Fimbriimonadaceae bacterium]
MVTKRDYDAFGNVISSTGAWDSAFGYAGGFGYEEDATGLKLLGHRYYDSSTGRFLTRDPIKDGRNWYSYGAGEANPVTGVDPDGLMLMALLTLEINKPSGPSPFGGGNGSQSDDPWEIEWLKYVGKLPVDALAPTHPGDVLEPLVGIPYVRLDARNQMANELPKDPLDEDNSSSLTWYQDSQHWQKPYVPSWGR